MSELGRYLMIIGLALAAVGTIIWLMPKVPWLGKLPLDFHFKRENFTFYFPLGTCILISIILTLILALFRKK